MIGLAKSDFALSGSYLGQVGDSIGAMFDESSSRKIYANGSGSTNGTGMNPGDSYHFAINFQRGYLWVRSTNVAGWWGGGDPETYTTPTSTFSAGQSLYAAIALYKNTSAVTVNFGASAFTGTVPSGYTSWQTSGGIIGSTRILLHFNGTDGATITTEETGHPVSFVNNAQLDTAQSKFGGSSLLLDGTNDAVYLPTNLHFDPGTQDFSIEAFIRLNANGIYQYICSNWQNVSNGISFGIKDTNKLVANVSGDGEDIVGTTSLTTGTWYHVALSRVSGNLYLHLDGVSDATPVANSTNIISAGQFTLGALYNGSYISDYNGWIDEFRMRIGTGYSSNFTPPASEFSV